MFIFNFLKIFLQINNKISASGYSYSRSWSRRSSNNSLGNKGPTMDGPVAPPAPNVDQAAANPPAQTPSSSWWPNFSLPFWNSKPSSRSYSSWSSRSNTGSGSSFPQTNGFGSHLANEAPLQDQGVYNY